MFIKKAVGYRQVSIDKTKINETSFSVTVYLCVSNACEAIHKHPAVFCFLNMNYYKALASFYKWLCTNWTFEFRSATAKKVYLSNASVCSWFGVLTELLNNFVYLSLYSPLHSRAVIATRLVKLLVSYQATNRISPL